MTQEQYQWLKDNGYDPAVYDVDEQGNVFENPVAAPASKQKMSPLRAAGTSFLGNLLPAGAGLGAGSLLAPLALSNPWTGIPAVIGGSMLAAYGAGKGQEAALEKLAPEALQQLAQAEQDQPVMSYLGGFAPNALAFRPSVQGMKGLLRPTVRGTETLTEALAKPEFIAPAANIAANVAGSTAGQLVNVAQGGEFSAPRFAADVALGTLFNKPNALGRRMGFQDIPEPRREAPGDLAAAREQAAFMEYPPSEFVTPREERLDIGADKFGVEQFFTPEGKPMTEKAMAKDYTNWWKSETEPTTDLIKGAAEEIKMKVPKERLAELAQDPEVGAALRDPSRMPAFIAKQAEQSLEDVYQMMVRREVEQRFASPEEAANQTALQELRAERGLPSETALSDVEAAYAASKKTAFDAAREVYTRLQRPEGAGENKITQEDINLATEIANRRGLKIELDRAYAGDQQVRGMFFVDPKTGDRIIRINPLMATADTAIHEIGHDVFKGVTNKGMRRSLMDTALDSPAYKAELAARAEEVKAGRITQEQANDIALEEGLIQAFGEQMPQVKRGELRAWYQAFKASMKQLVTGKMSPEDALAWMHYATTEAVPWKGAAVAKVDVGGEERFSRAKELSRRLEIDDIDWATLSDRDFQREVSLEDVLSSMDPNLKILQDKPNLLNEYVVISREPRLALDRDAWGKAYTTGARNEGHVLIDAGVWDSAVDNDWPGAREKFLHVLKHELGHIDDAPNIGEYGSVRDERVADEFAARYQRAQQETPEFKAWFGESKVVDAEGKPLVVYHGTPYGKFSERADSINATRQDMLQARAKAEANFWAATDLLDETRKKYGRVSSNPESLQARELYESAVKDMESAKRNIPYEEEPGEVFRYMQAQDRGYLGAGFYFTPDKYLAKGYSGTSYRPRVAGEQALAPHVYETYLSIKNPYTGNEPIVSPKTDANAEYRLKNIRDIDQLQREQSRIMRDRLIESGFDGVIRDYGEGVEYVAFYPEQIKSATENKGTFDPSNPDIRYQRGPIDRLRNFSEVDSLESRGGIFSQVAQGMRNYYATRKFMQGQASSKEQAMSSLSPELQVMLGKHIGQEFDQQRFIQPPSEIAEAYNEYRNEWQKFWPTETNKAGHTVRTAGGQRARLTDPYYGPFHMWSDSVRDIITTKQGSPEYVKLKDDYIKQHTQFHQQNGVPLQEAQARSLAEFNDAIREMSVPYDPTAVGTFAGARKAQGIPLPESWREYNIMKLVENYDRRSAMDYAMQEHMEKSPEIMAALGAEKYFNDQPIPPQIKASVPYIGDDNSVKSILREMSGKPAFRPDALGAGASRSIGALTIGTVSKATEIPTTMIAGLRYLQASDYLPGTMKFIENLADWSALQERSYASGLNKRDGAQNMRQVAGVIGDASGYMNKFAEGVSKYTGLNALEQGARTIAQGWGEVLVQINKRKAATGDKEAVRMLDTLSPDWRTRSDADLAGQFGQLMQGSYDMTQLPAWMLESGAAPYLTWSKWSAGQYNSFMKFAIEPALQGNVKPLLGHLLIGVMGGAAVEQIREWMNNREGRDVNWSELESWMQENQGELGAEGVKQLSVKLLNMVQNVGTFGIAGDLAKMVTTAAVGGSAQGMATAPVANAVFDTSKKVAAALKAIDDGEDFGLVLRQMMLDVAKSHVQVARVGQNWLDEDENLRYDDRRKRRLFDELTGAPTQSGAFSVNYGNLAEREFERGEITEKTGEEAFSLVSRAREEATTPEDYASRIRKLQTSQNQIMPSLERQPMKAARYLSFVEGAEEGAGAETMRRYMTREYENKYRKSLIEGMSGLR